MENEIIHNINFKGVNFGINPRRNHNKNMDVKMTTTSQENISAIVKKMNEANNNMEKAFKDFKQVYERERLVYTTAAGQLSVINAQEIRDKKEPL